MGPQWRRFSGPARTLGRVHATVRRIGASCLVAATSTLVLAGCGTNATSASSTSGTTASPVRTGSGPVDVLYAGSLTGLMEQQLGPQFDHASGYRFQGTGGGSTALASQIRGRTTKADVFISASPAVNASLEGAANGNRVSWYATFATSKLVIGYNPKSRFATELRSKPWYEVIGSPGFRFGTTDPTLDPKGKLGEQALHHAAATHHVPALDALANGGADVQPESGLVGRLQSGQLDAGFFYASEAHAAGIPTVPLTGEDLDAVYTVTRVADAPDPTAADAFIAYLLGPDGSKVLRANGFDVVAPPTVTGTGVPTALRHVFGH